ncbi:MAG: hypothetical protein KC635_11745 [Myxococcales bacterium]|nr:hypothetical protein [Myxococcales bacterium]MCB9731576.1 hypothetical protein [Deltaproteobacteria bacterium]
MRWLVPALVLALAACTSSPTPHPSSVGDTVGGGGLADSAAPSPPEDDLDRDNDGTPDCEQLGGTFADGECVGKNGEAIDPGAVVDADAVGSADTGDDADVVGGDATPADAAEDAVDSGR